MGGKTNAKPSALLTTAECEGRFIKLTEHSVSKPKLAYILGKVAKSANAQSPHRYIC